MIKCNENENDNEKLDRIDKTNRPKVNIETNMQDIGCLYVISNTEATFEAQFINKWSNTDAELSKSVGY